jgi:hypothetical protein
MGKVVGVFFSGHGSRLLLEANGASRTQLEGGARHGPARLIEELIAAWEAQEHVEDAHIMM